MKNIILAQDKGGSGKSLFAAAIALEATKRKLPVTAVEIETSPRMSKVYPKLFSYQRVAPPDEEVLRSGSVKLVLGVYDSLMESLKNGGLIADTGSNVTKAALSKMRLSAIDYYVGAGESVGFVIPATANVDSLSEAAHIIAQINDVLPKAQIFLIENSKEGPLPTGGRWFEATRNKGNVQVFSLPLCVAETWPKIAARPLQEILTLTRDSLISQMGISPPDAARDLANISEFATNVFRIASEIVNWMSADEKSTQKKSA